MLAVNDGARVFSPSLKWLRPEDDPFRDPELVVGAVHPGVVVRAQDWGFFVHLDAIGVSVFVREGDVVEGDAVRVRLVTVDPEKRDTRGTLAP